MPPDIESLINLSRDHEKAGRYAEALRAAQQALVAALDAGDGPGACGGLANLAYVHFRLGHYDRSQRLAAEALTHSESVPHSATALLVLGLCAMETDDPSQAEDFFQRAADLSREIGYPLGLSLSQHNLSLARLGTSRAARMEGDWPAARD